MLERLKRSVVACERLTERLLSLTRGALADTELRPVSLDGVVTERLTLVDSAAQDLTVRSDLQPVVVRGDPALLRQLVENLIENAIKYNVPDGWIEVSVGAEGDQAVLEVSNSGPKLDQDELAGLLEPFRRATRQRVGTSNGLGLSIVRTIVAAHDGQLALNALSDGGLRVTVTLPSTPAQPTAGGAAPAAVIHGRQ